MQGRSSCTGRGTNRRGMRRAAESSRRRQTRHWLRPQPQPWTHEDGPSSTPSGSTICRSMQTSPQTPHLQCQNQTHREQKEQLLVFYKHSFLMGSSSVQFLQDSDCHELKMNVLKYRGGLVTYDEDGGSPPAVGRWVDSTAAVVLHPFHWQWRWSFKQKRKSVYILWWVLGLMVDTKRTQFSHINTKQNKQEKKYGNCNDTEVWSSK